MAVIPKRDLRRLAKRFRIAFKPPLASSDWPLVHKATFESIRKIGDLKFDTFSASIDIRSSEEPWRERVKYRAEWLASCAARLFSQRRNESGWRFSVENVVLQRFGVEVACPKCRARIWRSEIEAAISETDDLAACLQERRNNRKPCECPPNDRPQDYYEIGTNPLFDDRTQEMIYHDPLIRSQLPNQEPDRVYGLQATKNFNQLLSQTASGSLGASDGITVGERVRSSPFREGTEPLLFPFLILEAKSESSSNGFGDTQIQTAFPIFALLKLQEDLQAQAKASELGAIPLVWFFANRGDAWRVYGCFVSDSETSRYDIVQLWDGSIMSKDSALQLLLIVDYIFDWARDIYRPSILRQLKSLASGEAYDQISLANDSDIMSMRRHISDWIQPPPSTVGSDFDAESANPTIVLDHQNLLPIQIPNTKLGTLRSASLVNSRVVGLYIAEHNVRTFLELAAGTPQNTSHSEKAAREVVSFLTRWEELIVLNGDDIDKIDMTWTGKARITDETPISSSSEKFYFLAEFATFMDTSWNIVRQLTYLAVSKPAFEILVRYADYKVKHPRIEAISQLGRPCSPEAFIESLNCLQSGSIDQVFMTALSCILVSLYSMPERKRLDYVPQTEALGFGALRRPRLLEFVQKFHKVGTRKTRPSNRVRRPKGLIWNGRDLSWNGRSLFASSERRKGARQANTHQPDPRPRLGPEDQSFIRVSEEKVLVSDKEGHETALCERCRRFRFCGGRDPHHMAPSSEHIFSAYGMSLVVASNRADRSETNYDICLFASKIPPEISDNTELPVVVTDLIQSGSIYHTIRDPVEVTFPHKILERDQLWNLPSPYRPSTAKQHSDILDWLDELRGLHLGASRKAARNGDDEVKKREGAVEDWNGLQLLLHFLSEGQSYSQANLSVRVAQAQGESREILYRILDKDEEMRANAGVKVHRSSDGGPNWLLPKLSTKGDSGEKK